MEKPQEARIKNQDREPGFKSKVLSQDGYAYFLTSILKNWGLF